MKKFIIPLLFLLSLSLVACDSKVDDTEEETSDEEAYITLASEAEDYFPLRASFMSDNRSMVYTFDYDGNLLKMMDSKFEGASTYGANFKAEGGAEITTATYFKEDFVAPIDKVVGDCSFTYESLKHEEEVLVMQMKVCEGDDEMLAEEAMQSLLDGLMMEWL
jgi:hypothetical protein